MKTIPLAVALALACALPVHAQDKASIVLTRPDTVVVQDPDPATPEIQKTTTVTTVDHATTVTPTPAPVHHPVHHHHPAHHANLAYHHPAPPPVKAVETTDTRTTTQTTVTIPAHESSTVVSEHGDGSVTVTSDRPPVIVPADADDDQH